ncbi:TIGR04283 family arsenosugar biosynthesis glycosyltransferase [Runella sp. MFBS21]|uniref:TIGR04283 family arsenosugar biosynthesis glycosyltransferase n=1 Tax=Runella sp. MFBS21 TaxID=3034018 RepID=UPI0023F89512|nr:TIGR04283 family arsenosugar biosynthesis glycosyltransferase [Runella sp. MFBS21]MDF7820286.1 TIGR04283 family arsenosugar biosynthesis glycosyltransferase [Runella sp. MFBS21]
MHTISVIIPTLNEEKNIENLVQHLQKDEDSSIVEIIVVDGGSIDHTLAVALKAGAVAVRSPQKGRAAQMNFGAHMAKGNILYFIHADARPPLGFAQDILGAIQEGFQSGCYRFRFDSPKTLLKINNYFTRFKLLAVRGGDQTLFITREWFDKLNGFDERYVIMEEYDLLRRLWRQNRSFFKVIPKNVLISARKYDNNSWLRVQIANLVAMTLFKLGTSPLKIAHIYKKMLH